LPSPAFVFERIEMAKSIRPCDAMFCGPKLDLWADMHDNAKAVDGGVPVSTWEMRQLRHAEDGSLASLIIGPKTTANEELALAA